MVRKRKKGGRKALPSPTPSFIESDSFLFKWEDVMQSIDNTPVDRSKTKEG